VGDAVNVTEVPVQIVFDGDAEMLTAGVIPDVTLIVIVLEVAVAGLAHDKFELIRQ
jgi:hypothetical protein